MEWNTSNNKKEFFASRMFKEEWNGDTSAFYYLHNSTFYVFMLLWLKLK